MPESPEVEALAGFLRARVVGKRVGGIELEEARALKTRSRPLSELHGRTVAGVRRFGKHLAIDTDGPTLLVSFGRAGWGRWRDDTTDAEAPGPDDPPVIARIAFDGGSELAVTDAGDWLSLGLHVVGDPAEVSSVAKLGPDPASDAFTRGDFDAVVTGRRKQLKALLQEQESLSGIGNAYSDEILYAARLSPVAHASTLDDEERTRLFDAIREVLGGAFQARRDVPPAKLKAAKVASMAVHGRTGEPCPEGHDSVLDVPHSKGAAQYCAACQTGGVPLPE